MSKPAYNFFNHTFTSFSSTGQKVLQTCPSLTKLLPVLHILGDCCTDSLFHYFFSWIEINWHLAGSKQTVDVVTSFDSVRAVHVEKETITTSGGRTSLNLHASVNEKEILALETAYQDFSELTFKLSTSCQLLNDVQVIYNLKSVSDFSLVASYNDVFDTRFIGKVASLKYRVWSDILTKYGGLTSPIILCL